MYIYRFKTKEEFINEFGENFRKTISPPWNLDGYMDYLFGLQVPRRLYMLAKSRVYIYNSWLIGLDMLCCEYIYRAGEIVVVISGTGNRPGTITKIVSTKGKCSKHEDEEENRCTGNSHVLCEAITDALGGQYINSNHTIVYANKPVWHERIYWVRPATEEEKYLYAKAKKRNMAIVVFKRGYYEYFDINTGKKVAGP